MQGYNFFVVFNVLVFIRCFVVRTLQSLLKLLPELTENVTKTCLRVFEAVSTFVKVSQFTKLSMHQGDALFTFDATVEKLTCSDVIL